MTKLVAEYVAIYREADRRRRAQCPNVGSRRLISRRAIVILCTSSGPSAMRSVRTWAYIAASGVNCVTPAAPCTWIARSMHPQGDVRDDDLDAGDLARRRLVALRVHHVGGVQHVLAGHVDLDA